MTRSQDFAAETSDASERERLGALQRLFDPQTFSPLDETGVGEGWQCLELGAGGSDLSRFWRDSFAIDAGRLVECG